MQDDEDTSDLRKCFLSFIVDHEREIIRMMNENLVIMVQKYGNTHTIENFKDRTPYVDSSDDNESKETSPRSKQSKGSMNTDFSGAFIDSSKKAIQKKNTHLGIIDHSDFDDQ